jgi:hypothetical protein
LRSGAQGGHRRDSQAPDHGTKDTAISTSWAPRRTVKVARPSIAFLRKILRDSAAGPGLADGSFSVDLSRAR